MATTEDPGALVARAEELVPRLTKARRRVEYEGEADTLAEAENFLTDLCALVRQQAAEIERLTAQLNAAHAALEMVRRILSQDGGVDLTDRQAADAINGLLEMVSR